MKMLYILSTILIFGCRPVLEVTCKDSTKTDFCQSKIRDCYAQAWQVDLRTSVLKFDPAIFKLCAPAECKSCNSVN